MQTFASDGWLRFHMEQRSAAIVCFRTAHSLGSPWWQGRTGQARRLSHDGQGQARRLSHGTASAVPNRIATEGIFHGQLATGDGRSPRIGPRIRAAADGAPHAAVLRIRTGYDGG